MPHVLLGAVLLVGYPRLLPRTMGWCYSYHKLLAINVQCLRQLDYPLVSKATHAENIDNSIHTISHLFVLDLVFASTVELAYRSYLVARQHDGMLLENCTIHELHKDTETNQR